MSMNLKNNDKTTASLFTYYIHKVWMECVSWFLECTLETDNISENERKISIQMYLLWISKYLNQINRRTTSSFIFDKICSLVLQIFSGQMMSTDKRTKWFQYIPQTSFAWGINICVNWIPYNGFLCITSFANIP